MAKFDDYTQKNTPEDNDITLILDKTANVNKKTPFSGIWTWIVNKMTNAVIQNLQTTNKTVIGAINELNSKSKILYGGTEIPQNSDMNSYNKFGNYYCPTNSAALTLKNAPFTEAFTMTVEAAAGTSDKYQGQIYRRLEDGTIAYRYYSNDVSGWMDYVYFIGKATLS